MKASEIRRCLVPIKTYCTALALLKDVFYYGDEDLFANALRHIELENPNAKFLTQLQNMHQDQDAEGLAYLLLAENKKMVDSFLGLMAKIDNMAEVWPKIRMSYLDALMALYINQINTQDFLQRFLNVLAETRIYENQEFWEVFAPQIAERLGVELLVDAKDDPQTRDWYVDLCNVVVRCKYVLVSLGMLEHAFYDGADEYFNVWQNQLQEFYVNQQKMQLLAQLRNQVIDESDDEDYDEDDDGEDYNQETISNQATAIFHSIAEEITADCFEQCLKNSKNLAYLDDADLLSLEKLIDDVFADMTYDEHLQGFDLYGKMAKLLCKWQKYISKDFVVGICARVPDEKEYLFYTTLQKYQTGALEVKVDDGLLRIFYQSQNPDAN